MKNLNDLNFTRTTKAYLIGFFIGLYILVSSILNKGAVVGGSWASLDDSPSKFWFYIIFIGFITLLVGYWFIKSLFEEKDIDDETKSE